MADETVVDLFGKPVVPREANQNIVDYLRRLLADAEKGKVYSIGVVALRHAEPSPDVDVVHLNNCVLLVGGVSRLAHRCNLGLDETATSIDIRS